MINIGSLNIDNIYVGNNDVSKIYIGNDLVYEKSSGGGGRLPAGYQEVEYIESTGTQYIDTNVNLSSSDVVKCKFELTATTESLADAILGAYDGTNFFVLLMRSPTQARVGTSSNQTTSTNSQVNTLYDISLTNGTYVENGITYTFTPASDFTQIKSCYIMFRNQVTASVIPVSAKVYSFEIVGKFNGIPCIRKSDGVTGMYDLINSTFLANAGTGSFIRGPVVLPNQYQQIQYVENSGTQYINTNITTSNVDTVEIKTAIADLTKTTQYFAGTRDSYSTAIGYALYFTAHNGVNYYPREWSADSAGVTPQQNEMFVTKTEFKNGTDKFYYNGTLRNTHNHDSAKYNTGNVIFIGAIRQADASPNYISYTRYYEVKFMKNEGLVADFIPCYRKSDNTIGMYDIINNTFYTNAGSGTFIKGNDV